jgi:hypothetical protein
LQLRDRDRTDAEGETRMAGYKLATYKSVDGLVPALSSTRRFSTPPS